MEESLRRRSGTARMDYTFALTPALSPRRGGGVRGVCGSRRTQVLARLLGGRPTRSPSPRPSPPGEGEARAAFAETDAPGCSRAFWAEGRQPDGCNRGHRAFKQRPEVLPLPGGEGRGEGEPAPLPSDGREENECGGRNRAAEKPKERRGGCWRYKKATPNRVTSGPLGIAIATFAELAIFRPASGGPSAGRQRRRQRSRQRVATKGCDKGLRQRGATKVRNLGQAAARPRVPSWSRPGAIRVWDGGLP